MNLTGHFVRIYILLTITFNIKTDKSNFDTQLFVFLQKQIKKHTLV